MLACGNVIVSMSRDALFAALGIIGALKDYKDAAAAIESAAAAIESAAKVIALLVAGWWTWQTYIRKRVKFPSGSMLSATGRMAE